MYEFSASTHRRSYPLLGKVGTLSVAFVAGSLGSWEGGCPQPPYIRLTFRRD